MTPGSFTATVLHCTLLIVCLCGSVARASVRVELSGGGSPLPGQVVPGSTVTLKVTAIGQGANPNWQVAWGETDLTKATFQWFRSGTAIPGATQASLVIPNASAADAGNYSVRVTSSVPAVDWGMIAINLTPAPAGQFVDTSFTAPDTSRGTDINLNGTRITGIATILADGSVVTVGQSLGDLTGWKVFGPNGAYLNGWVLDTVHYAGSTRVWPDGTVVLRPNGDAIAPSIFTVDGKPAPSLPTGFAYDKLSAMLVDGARVLIAQDHRLVRLDAGRALDPGFTAELPAGTSAIGDIELDSTGNYLVVVSDTVRQTLVRLDRSGAADPTFTPFIFPANTDNARPVPQIDGSILFSVTPDDHQTTQIVRLSASGARDPNFAGHVPFGFTRIDSRGHCYGTVNGRLWRYLAAGEFEIDSSFHPGAPDAANYSIALDSQDRVIAVGEFTSWNGHATVNVARVLPIEGEVPLLPAVWLQWESPGIISTAYPHAGGRLAFRAIVAGRGPFNYEWVALDGGKLPANTHDRELVFDAFSAENLGRYQLRVSSAAGVSLSDIIDLSATSLPPVTLVNLSGRAIVGTDENAPIAGFVTNTTHGGERSFLLRGVGPALKTYGVNDTATDPVLRVYDARGSMTNESDNWDGSGLADEFANVGAFPFAVGSVDAALSYSWPGGAHTVRLTDKQPHDGVGMIEIYDRWAASDYFPGQLLNLSLRAQVSHGDKIAIAGFVLVDSTGFGRSLRMLVRGVGPTLATLGIQHPLANPKLALFNGKGELLRTNDNWAENANATEIAAAMKQVGAFELPANSNDAALLVDLPAGVYTTHVSGVDDATGVALLEVYVVR